VDSIHDQKSRSPESLAARAFAGFWQLVKTGRKTALTTGLTTDRKNFHFRPQRGIMAKTEYPGVAKVVSRLIWVWHPRHPRPETPEATRLCNTAACGIYSDCKTGPKNSLDHRNDHRQENL